MGSLNPPYPNLKVIMPNFKEPTPKHKPFYCGAYWHLWRRGLPLSIYNLMGAVTNGGEREFYATQATVARYFGAHKQAVAKAFRGLRKGGWIQFAATKSHFLWISHESWAEARPKNEDGECAECAQRKLLPWELNPDPLVCRLHAISGGKLRLYDQRAESIRRLARKAAGLAQFPELDEEICFLFSREIAEAQDARDRGQFKGTSPSACLWRVEETFRDRIAKLAAIPVEK
jgi:hypothetical protein